MEINGYATGSLHVVVNGGFGAVCSQSFGDSEASVSSRQLGLQGGVMLPLVTDAGPRYLPDQFRESLTKV